MITVDCGVRSIREVELANELGMDMIISDHHHPGSNASPSAGGDRPQAGRGPIPGEVPGRGGAGL